MNWGEITAIVVPVASAAVVLVRGMAVLETKLGSIDDKLKLITQQHGDDRDRQQKQIDDHEVRLRALEKASGKG